LLQEGLANARGGAGQDQAFVVKVHGSTNSDWDKRRPDKKVQLLPLGTGFEPSGPGYPPCPHGQSLKQIPQKAACRFV
jgi:hypothetical protein